MAFVMLMFVEVEKKNRVKMIKMEKLKIIKEKPVLLYGFLVLFGIITAFILVYPHFFDVGPGGQMDWRMPRVYFRYENLINNGTVFTGERDALSAYGLYLPYLMEWLGITDTTLIGCIWQGIFGFVVIMLYPLLIYKIFDNLTVSILSPFIAHFAFGDWLYVNKCGEYFSTAWMVAIGMPLLILLFKQKEKKGIIVITMSILIAMMLTNTIRYSTAVPLLGMTMLILLWKLLKKETGIILMIILCVILISGANLLNKTIPKAVSEAEGIYEPNYRTLYPWHALLIGLGYIENDYGLSYADGVAYEIVGERFPGEENKYPNPQYFECCKIVYLEILREDPGFAIKAYMAKILECIRLQIRVAMKKWWLSIAVIVLGIMTFIRKKKDFVREIIPVFVVSYMLSVAACIFGIIAIPIGQYLQGGMAGIGVMLMLMVLCEICEIGLNKDDSNVPIV